MVSSVCGGKKVRSMKTSLAWWWKGHGLGLHEFCRHWDATIHWGNHANMYRDILKQSMIPSLRTLGRREVFQHDNDHCLAKEAEGKGNLRGILKWKVEEHKVSNIHQLRDVVMEEWKRTPVVTFEALVNSMPKRVKAVLENNNDHTKYWHFGHNLEYIIIFYIYNLFIFFPLSVGDTLDVLLYYLLLIGCFTCCFII